jgi:hypothetical protein
MLAGKDAPDRKRSDPVHARRLKPQGIERPKNAARAEERTMKLIVVSSLLVLGLLVQVTEANAVVCAAGAYHAGCAGPRGAVVGHRPVGYGGAAVVRRPYGAAVVRPAYGVHRRVVY